MPPKRRKNIDLSQPFYVIALARHMPVVQSYKEKIVGWSIMALQKQTLVVFAIAAVLAAAAVFLVRIWISSVAQNQESGSAIVETVPVVVTTTEIALGQPLIASQLVIKEWPAALAPEGVFSQISDVVPEEPDLRRFALAPLTRNEPVLALRVTEPGRDAKLSSILRPDSRAVAIRVNDVQGVAGFVFPGDQVDIYLTRRSGCEIPGVACVLTLLSEVKVLAIDQSSLTTPDEPVVAKTVTLEVTTEQAQALTLASTLGTLSLGLRSTQSDDSPPPPVLNERDLLGSIQGAEPKLSNAHESEPGFSLIPSNRLLVEDLPLPAPLPEPSKPAPPPYSIKVLEGQTWVPYSVK
jgi:pilus assembly protein CpaB